MNLKISKTVFVIAIVLMFLEIGLAHYAVIRPMLRITYRPILHFIILADFVAFPLTLAVISSFLLDRIKRLDKKSYLISFLSCSGFFIGLFALEMFTHLGNRLGLFLRFLSEYISIPVFPFALLGVPVASMLGWKGWSVFTIMALVAIFSFSIVFSLLYSWLYQKKKNGKGVYIKVLNWILIIFLAGSFIFAADRTYVSSQADKGECIIHLNSYQCLYYEKIAHRHFSYKGDVYYYNLDNRLEGEDPDSFKVIKGKGYEKFAVGNNAYYLGEVIPVTNIDKWAVIENSEHYQYDNRHSADDVNVFYKTKILEFADPETTVVFYLDYACNDQYVYLNGDIIEGADPDTYRHIGEYPCKEARDKL